MFCAVFAQIAAVFGETSPVGAAVCHTFIVLTGETAVVAE